MSSKNSETFEPHRLLLNLADKTTLQRSDKCVSLSNLSMYYTWKNIKKWYKKTINSKYQLQHRMKKLIYLLDCILYHILRLI